jgi:hypothetical protein
MTSCTTLTRRFSYSTHVTHELDLRNRTSTLFYGNVVDKRDRFVRLVFGCVVRRDAKIRSNEMTQGAKKSSPPLHSQKRQRGEG